MNFYPKATFTIDTTLSTSELSAALNAVTEPQQWFRWGATEGKLFHGECSGDGFTLWRIITYRNSFLPIIEGRITPAISGCRVAVTMRLHRFVAAFMIFWLGFVGVSLVFFVTVALNGSMELIPGVLVPLGMLVFGIALTSGAFWWEVKKTRPLIQALLTQGRPPVSL